jgi:lysozyme family protein
MRDCLYRGFDYYWSVRMITSFDQAFASICGIEGGYSNNPADTGGETMYGITERVARANGYDGDMKSLPLSTAKTIAKSEYWDKYQCDQFDARIGYQVFDAAFNGGHPALWLQKSSGATQDGVIGAGTIAAVRASDPMKIIMRFCAYHAQYYAALKKPEFINGWCNRIAANLLLGAA